MVVYLCIILPCCLYIIFISLLIRGGLDLGLSQFLIWIFFLFSKLGPFEVLFTARNPRCFAVGKPLSLLSIHTSPRKCWSAGLWLIFFKIDRKCSICVFTVSFPVVVVLFGATTFQNNGLADNFNVTPPFLNPLWQVEDKSMCYVFWSCPRIQWGMSACPSHCQRAW